MMTALHGGLKRHVRSTLTASLFALLVATSTDAAAQEASVFEASRAETGSPPAEDALLVEVRAWLARDDAPHCDLRRLLHHEERVYAACGAAGLLVLEAGPPLRVAARRNVDGVATDVSVQNDRVFVEVTRSIEIVTSKPPPDPQPSKPSPPPVSIPSPRVVLNVGEHVIIDRGAAQGLREGDHIEFAAESDAAFNVPLGVGVVSALATHRARVELGSEASTRRIPLGSRARMTERAATQPHIEPRSSTAHLQVMARPFISFGEPRGGGALFDAELDFRGSGAFGLKIAISPFGYGALSGNDVASFSGFVMPTYETRYLRLGAGIGVQTLNDSGGEHAPGTGTMWPLYVRVGQSEGPHLGLRLDPTLFYSDFHFGGLRVDGRLPLFDGNFLFANGGGGNAGYAFGEVGLGFKVTRDGPGGLEVLTSLGAVRLWSQPKNDPAFSFSERDAISAGGPLLGLGVRYQLY